MSQNSIEGDEVLFLKRWIKLISLIQWLRDMIYKTRTIEWLTKCKNCELGQCDLDLWTNLIEAHWVKKNGET